MSVIYKSVQVPTDNTFIQEQQKKAFEVLQKLRIIYPEACLAGGAPRNWFLDKVANDLDFYLFESNADLLYQRLQNLGFKYLKRKVKEGYSNPKPDLEKSNFNLVVYECNYEGVVVQFIAFDIDDFNELDAHKPNVESLAYCIDQTFDFGICKILWDGVSYLETFDFINDYMQKTMTINMEKMLKTHQVLKLSNHSKKLSEYFPDYKIVIA